MGRQSGRKQRFLLRSKLAIIDNEGSDDNHGTFSMKSPRQYKRIVTAKDVRVCFGRVTNKLKFVGRDQIFRSGCGSTTEVETPASSTDYVQGSIDTSNRSSSSSSPAQFRRSSRERGEVSPLAQDYTVLSDSTVGEGISGEVRKCIHRDTLELCAVKTIRKDRIRRKDRIYREIDFMRQVRHPNVVALYDIYEDQKEVNLVMELCHGGELFDKIIEKAEYSKTHGGKQQVPSCFREEDAARIVYSLLSATSYLHSMDIVHRDIKPENVLFTEKDDDESPIKLIDFGLSARHRRDDKPMANTVGTSYYIAPEVLKGSYDRSCDLWSIGVIAYVLLSGRPPFNGQSDDVIFRKIRRGLDYNIMETSELWDGISRYAKDFIRCLLVMDPMDRWTADMAMEHPWLKIARFEARSKRRRRNPHAASW